MTNGSQLRIYRAIWSHVTADRNHMLLPKSMLGYDTYQYAIDEL